MWCCRYNRILAPQLRVFDDRRINLRQVRAREQAVLVCLHAGLLAQALPRAMASIPPRCRPAAAAPQVDLDFELN